ncbi:MAG: hypothetical protein A3G32_01350 [Deltaproteobacteria bacterium RIFCSPLOWO2_12_FULL_40_28]|nr:MAG: hypothetical protein A3C45_10235 [Deltaproteobacteria bacterium RIFCSPHIGHO2_02_FULL_40_28]OGQ19974.1 MAG: hypothetical protein A3E27_07185 [Deltaproteobacteria bacterium RIFCSPHIGHO2_12_FULL_40_32]OGQ39734.1 MAG: hypothetical protein A3I69_06615 [Deltaproteobacteria bacterium RIFCSPLOWO2_02_FULL_40_36]OGQ52989.1 MAG: hypothetical protein A3G32_01350 [Deltaproteobacteria bacterium RIFCSPLOWO2_12_FULL_40_28]
MTRFEFGDIVLLNAFPYFHLSEVKKRPAVVLADTGDYDFIIARITSGDARDAYDFVVSSWKQCGLLLASVIRLSKIATLDKRLVLKKLGKLGSPERKKIRSHLKILFDL